MKLFTDMQRAKLLENGKFSANDPAFDAPPVVKLFTPDASCTWLLSELDPEDPDIAFGLCDLGIGFPELGCVSIREIQSVRGTIGLPVERDRHFAAQGPLSAYADLARVRGHIVDRLPDLEMELD